MSFVDFFSSRGDRGVVCAAPARQFDAVYGAMRNSGVAYFGRPKDSHSSAGLAGAVEAPA
jgi:hypothetical protein